jgi:hypothetical protein
MHRVVLAFKRPTRVAIGHAAAAPPNSVMNSRRRMCPQKPNLARQSLALTDRAKCEKGTGPTSDANHAAMCRI